MSDSPCIKLCRIDPVSGWCGGCLRSLDEIARWGAMPPGDRRNVLAQLPGRRAALRDQAPIPPRGS
ncbi:DUF1289 domain-containing protein [Paracoccus sp. (in: a-proteobacteria)]|uniref:DUF1289 domain-containing protein n=1 Tax=Paracoccus sp. TaxID=267 RepID=UPI00396C4DF1